MKSRILILAIVVLTAYATGALAQPPDTLWTRAYGDSLNDYGREVNLTSDGGYIIAGYTNSIGAGGTDFYLIKTNSTGDTLWTRTYGDSLNDYGRSAQQTTDGGYIFAGYSNSFGASYDYYLIKTNSTGDTTWTRTYGGIGTDYGMWVQQTTDGGYIIAGATDSYGAGSRDFYLVKTDSIGDTLWTRTYGGIDMEYCYNVRQTTDGGYIAAGYTTSYGAGGRDFYLVKTDSNGDTLWTGIYGGIDYDYGMGVQQTTDGGYIFTGYTNSYGAGGYDFYLIKTDSAGDTLWTRTYGGTETERPNEVQQTTDGGYIVAGYTNSFGLVLYDVYLIKTDSAGDTLWTLTCGGIESDYAMSVQQTTDGGYIVAGYTYSYGAGNRDIYLIRYEGQPLTITLTPHNPPIQILSGGGNFVFDLAIENNSTDPVNFDAWTLAILPNGIEYPLLLRPGLTLTAGGSIERELTQYIPPRALPGNYSYVGKVGTHPDVVLSDDSFPFEKLADDFGGPNHNQGWAVYGWLDEAATIISPSEYVLLSAYPNPFNPGTNLTYTLSESGIATLIVYNVLGKEIIHLADGWHQVGTYNVTFLAPDLPSGIYFARLKSEGSSITQKLLLIR